MTGLAASAALLVGKDPGSFGQVTLTAVPMKNRADGPRLMTSLTTVPLYTSHLIVCHQVGCVIIVMAFHASNGCEIDRLVRRMTTTAGVGPGIFVYFVATLACMALYGFQVIVFKIFV